MHKLTHHVFLSIDFLLALLRISFVGIASIVEKHVLVKKLGLPLEICDAKLHLLLLIPTLHFLL